MLANKNILLGICGSIAAYKSAILIRLLVKSGANVKVIMTDSAKDFISALTLSTLSKNPVYSSFYRSENGEWNNHVELGLWADHFVIAPCSANTIAKMASGTCDNLLLATYLSAKCPVSFAPAMDLDMYQHPATRKNIEKLRAFGNHMIQPGTGELASGLYGEGRMAEPEEIVEFLSKVMNREQDLAGKKILITAGPTYEALDPVRFIGNHSSGKMGYALAEECANRGANVILVSGPSSIKLEHPSIRLIAVQTAEEMYTSCITEFDNSDIAIMSAAVADYTPVKRSAEKIKKTEDRFSLELQKTKDILKSLGERKKHQKLIGFALETSNEIGNAQSKLKNKNADMIILNSLNDKGAGFGTDTNKISFILPGGSVEESSLKSKKDVASDIVTKIVSLL